MKAVKGRYAACNGGGSACFSRTNASVTEGRPSVRAWENDESVDILIISGARQGTPREVEVDITSDEAFTLRGRVMNMKEHR